MNPSDKSAPEDSVGPNQDYYLLELFVEEKLTSTDVASSPEACWRDTVLIFFSVGFLSMVALFWNLIVTSRREPEMPRS